MFAPLRMTLGKISYLNNSVRVFISHDGTYLLLQNVVVDKGSIAYGLMSPCRIVNRKSR